MSEAYSIEPTRVYKDRDGWNAKTKIVFPGDVDAGMGKIGKRVLTLSTTKSLRGELYTSASVSVSADGWTTFAICGDYSKTLVRERVRVTEKVVREQHARAMAGVNAIVGEVETFYAVKDGTAKAAARAKAEAEAFHATNRPGDQAAVVAEETGMDYSAALVACNMD